jgi:hypothetical protein
MVTPFPNCNLVEKDQPNNGLDDPGCDRHHISYIADIHAHILSAQVRDQALAFTPVALPLDLTLLYAPAAAVIRAPLRLSALRFRAQFSLDIRRSAVPTAW